MHRANALLQELHEATGLPREYLEEQAAMNPEARQRWQAEGERVTARDNGESRADQLIREAERRADELDARGVPEQAAQFRYQAEVRRQRGRRPVASDDLTELERKALYLAGETRLAAYRRQNPQAADMLERFEAAWNEGDRELAWQIAVAALGGEGPSGPH